MNKEEYEKRKAEIELKKKIEMQRYEIQKNILNPILATNNLENESDEQKIIIANNYLKYHIYGAEKRLKNIAHPNKENNFLDIDKILFEWSYQKDSRGTWGKQNNTIKISNIFLYECNFDEQFNEELIGAIQHEMIHAFISKNCSNFGMNVSTDGSPVHQAIITFFNIRGCNIESNGNLSDAFKSYQKEIYSFVSNIEVTFVNLIDKLNEWQEKLANKIEQFNENMENSATIVASFDKSTEKSYVNSKPNIPEDIIECIAETVRKGFARPINIIELGMDCEVENMEEFITRLINENNN